MITVSDHERPRLGGCHAGLVSDHECSGLGGCHAARVRGLAWSPIIRVVSALGPGGCHAVRVRVPPRSPIMSDKGWEGVTVESLVFHGLRS